MDYGNMVGDSFAYAKEAVMGKWVKWILLIIATVLLMLPLLGYTLKILRGESPAPEVEDWGTLFIDGIKYAIIMFIWMIPVMIVYGLLFGVMLAGAMSGDETAAMAGMGLFFVGMVVVVVLSIIIALFSLIGIVRFARTGSIGEAFNFSAIRATIAKIGWIPYIIALIVLGVCGAILEIVLGILCALLIGFLLLPFAIPVWFIFVARYTCLLYDSAGA
jgi:Protein of unknown function (DUF4013)